MSPLRNTLLRAARSARLRGFAENSRLFRPVVDRFVAGTTSGEALRTTADLVDTGRLVTLDYLGEDTASADQANRTVNAYRLLIGELDASGVSHRAEVSVKLSAIGQALPRDGDRVALDAAYRICAAAEAAKTTVTLDMEDHTTTDSTLAVLREVRADFPWVGAVLQAYLRRTAADCQDLATPGSRVRLCKGAYAEPLSVAFRGLEIDTSYRRCLGILLHGGGYPMIATHDPVLLAHAQAETRQAARSVDSYEYQMLHGVRPEAQRRIVESGSQLRVYVPFGEQWYGYFVRRLAERPANLAFFLRALTSRR
jgi:proline dehydrogenase